MPGGLESGPRSPWMALISPHLALEEKGPVLEATVALLEKLVAVVSPAPSHHPDLVQCLDSAQVPCRGVSSGH